MHVACCTSDISIFQTRNQSVSVSVYPSLSTSIHQKAAPHPPSPSSNHHPLSFRQLVWGQTYFLSKQGTWRVLFCPAPGAVHTHTNTVLGSFWRGERERRGERRRKRCGTVLKQPKPFKIVKSQIFFRHTQNYTSSVWSSLV